VTKAEEGRYWPSVGAAIAVIRIFLNYFLLHDAVRLNCARAALSAARPRESGDPALDSRFRGNERRMG
jgi:hypothetical protein